MSQKILSYAFWSVFALLVFSTFAAQYYAFSFPVQTYFYFGWLSWWQMYSVIFYALGALIYYLNYRYWRPKKPSTQGGA